MGLVALMDMQALACLQVHPSTAVTNYLSNRDPARRDSALTVQLETLNLDDLASWLIETSPASLPKLGHADGTWMLRHFAGPQDEVDLLELLIECGRIDLLTSVVTTIQLKNSFVVNLALTNLLHRCLLSLSNITYKDSKLLAAAHGLLLAGVRLEAFPTRYVTFDLPPIFAGVPAYSSATEVDYQRPIEGSVLAALLYSPVTFHARHKMIRALARTITQTLLDHRERSAGSGGLLHLAIEMNDPALIGTSLTVFSGHCDNFNKLYHCLNKNNETGIQVAARKFSRECETLLRSGYAQHLAHSILETDCPDLALEEYP